ncbi:uncharacterized protein [Leptinotarsa decemlineata]|uniref:uncharacterized protein n=1 Tax=Leptinotarsa decemlineata TaxID=7539 RepID=UPI003D308756
MGVITPPNEDVGIEFIPGRVFGAIKVKEQDQLISFDVENQIQNIDLDKEDMGKLKRMREEETQNRKKDMERLERVRQEEIEILERKRNEDMKKLFGKIDEQTNNVEKLEKEIKINHNNSKQELAEYKRTIEEKVEKILQEVEDNRKENEEQIDQVHGRKTTVEEGLVQEVNTRREENENLNKKIDRENKLTREKFKEHENNIHEKVIDINNKLKQTERNLSHREESIRPIIVIGNENKLIFTGNIERQHTVPFIEFIRSKYENLSFKQMKEVIRSQLQEEALLWFTNKEKELTNFDKLSNKFLSYFWGPSQQM